MAEMQTSDSGSHKKGSKKVRTKKMSTRVDLTAMVDLGFLLITFFMLATTMNKPKTMEVNKPAKEDKEDKQGGAANQNVKDSDADARGTETSAIPMFLRMKSTPPRRSRWIVWITALPD